MIVAHKYKINPCAGAIMKSGIDFSPARPVRLYRRYC